MENQIQKKMENELESLLGFEGLVARLGAYSIRIEPSS